MKTSAPNGKVTHRCVVCGRTYPHAYIPFCECGHFIEVYYDTDKATIGDSPSPYERYFDLLPIEDRANLIPGGHGMTPCHHAKALGKSLGLDALYLKDETVLPSGTTKDRMATVVISFFREVGVKTFCASSTGNSSSSFARFIKHHPEGRVILFAAEDFLDKLETDGNEEHAMVFAMRGATFVEACNMAREFAERKGLVADRGFFNPARREGLKLTFMEACEAVPRPIDWYVQAVSSAMGVYGTYKGAKELLAMGRIKKLPGLMCVQQQSNQPMVSAFEAGSDVIRPGDVVHHPRGIATSILRGDPTRVYPYVLGVVRESKGRLLSVSEQQIRDARRAVMELEGLEPCFTASAAVAGLTRLAREDGIPKDETILVNLTGRQRPPQTHTNVHWLERTPEGWQLEAGKADSAYDFWN